MGRRKFLTDYLAVMISIAFYSLRPLVLIPVILSNMGTTSYGIWAQILATSMLLSPLISLRLNNVLTRYLSGTEDGRHLSGAFLMATFVVIVSVGVIFFTGIWMGEPLAWLIYGNSEYTRFLWPAIAYSGSCAFFLVAGAYLNTIQRQVQFAVYRSVLVLGDCLIIFAFARIMDISDCTYALSAWQVALSIVILGGMVAQHGLAKPSLVGMPGLWPFLFSLLASHFLSFAAGNANRFVLVNLMGLENLAAFQVALQIATIVGLVGAPNQHILIPSLAGHWNRNEKEAIYSLVRLALLLLVLFGLPCMAFVAQVGPIAIGLLTRKSINADSSLLLILSAGVFLKTVFQTMTYSYHLTRQIWQVLIPVGISSIINIALPFVLVPSLGLRGAAVAYLASMFLLVLATYRHSALVFGTGPDWKQTYKAFIMAVAIYLALWPIRSLGMGALSILFLSSCVAGALWITGFLAFKFIPLSELKQWIKQQLRFTLGSPVLDQFTTPSADHDLRHAGKR
ncbi:MAG: lipopolysaccharide biosynthesis protein [Syntrophobacteraceae bacterium]|nr:lipopolysaccharide biosynthesis protein [Syntrophobacteraceae bacterium]